MSWLSRNIITEEATSDKIYCAMPVIRLVNWVYKFSIQNNIARMRKVRLCASGTITLSVLDILHMLPDSYPWPKVASQKKTRKAKRLSSIVPCFKTTRQERDIFLIYSHCTVVPKMS